MKLMPINTDDKAKEYHRLFQEHYKHITHANTTQQAKTKTFRAQVFDC